MILAVLEQYCRDDIEFSGNTVASTTFFKSFSSQSKFREIKLDISF
jgi:hypothetical protein